MFKLGFKDESAEFWLEYFKYFKFYRVRVSQKYKPSNSSKQYCIQMFLIRVCLVLKLNGVKRLFFMNMINDEEATGEESSFIFHVANLYF